MKLHLTALTLFIVAFTFAECSAEPPGRKGQGGAKAEGKRLGGDRAQGQNPGGRPGMDPAKMVARMMQQFDKDGDQKLDVKELTALFKAMRDRRGGGGRPGPGAGQGPQGEGRPGDGKPGARPQGRRPGGDKAGKAGGEKPKRPAAE